MQVPWRMELYNKATELKSVSVIYAQALTRERTHAIDSNHYKWAANMKDLLLETCKK